MHRTLQHACLIILSAAVAACQPQAQPEAASATTPTTDAAPAPAPVAPVSAPPAVSASDARAFAGRFVAGGSRIDLMGDGTFKLEDAGSAFDGTWTAEEDGTRIRLDPNSKAEQDRLYAVVDADRIELLDAAGKPAAGVPALHREGLR